jgi:hypothetical protein
VFAAWLLYILACITLVTAAIVFAFLNRRAATESSSEPLDAQTSEPAIGHAERG